MLHVLIWSKNIIINTDIISTNLSIPAMKTVRKLSTKSSISRSGFIFASLRMCSKTSVGVSAPFFKAKHRSLMTSVAKLRRNFMALMVEFWNGKVEMLNIQNGFWKLACNPSSVFDTAVGNSESGFCIVSRSMLNPTWKKEILPIL